MPTDVLCIKLCKKLLALFLEPSSDDNGIAFFSSFSPRKRWFVCVFVCLSVTTITKKIVDGFVPNFMG